MKNWTCCLTRNAEHRGQCAVTAESHARILDKSDNDDDGDDGQEKDSRHNTLDAADGRVAGLIKLTLLSTTVLGHADVRWWKHSNNSLWKSIGSFYHTVNNTSKRNIYVQNWRYLTASGIPESLLVTVAYTVRLKMLLIPSFVPARYLDIQFLAFFILKLLKSIHSLYWVKLEYVLHLGSCLSPELVRKVVCYFACARG